MSPVDNDNQGPRAALLTRAYNNGTVVSLTAPATAGGNNFQKWQASGVDYSTNPSITVTMDADKARDVTRALAAREKGQNSLSERMKDSISERK